MAQVRTRWMNSAERMVRAARHYERAVHLLIGAAVRSVRYAMADAADAVRCPFLFHVVDVVPKINLLGFHFYQLDLS